jgi:hypothetical protein
MCQKIAGARRIEVCKKCGASGDRKSISVEAAHPANGSCSCISPVIDYICRSVHLLGDSF